MQPWVYTFIILYCTMTVATKGQKGGCHWKEGRWRWWRLKRTTRPLANKADYRKKRQRHFLKFSFFHTVWMFLKPDEVTLNVPFYCVAVDHESGKNKQTNSKWILWLLNHMWLKYHCWPAGANFISLLDQFHIFLCFKSYKPMLNI